MGKKLLIIILLLIVFSCLGLYYVYNQSRKRAEFNAIDISTKERIQYAKDCEKTLNVTGRDYVVCSLDSDGKVYLTNDKRVFRPMEYLAFLVNIQRLNKYFDPYYICMYSDFPDYQEYLSNLTDFGVKACSELYYQKDYRRVKFSTQLADLPGKYTFAEIYLFPEMNFSSKEEFFNNLDKAVLVFNMTGEII